MQNKIITTKEERQIKCGQSYLKVFSTYGLRVSLSMLLLLGGSAYQKNQPIRALANEKGGIDNVEFPMGPTISFPDKESIYIWWYNNQTTALNEVYYGTTADNLDNCVSQQNSQAPFIKLTGLTPGVEYFYQVKAGKETSKVYKFKLPDPNQDFKIGIWGDNQNGKDLFKNKTVPALQAENADYYIALGDMSRTYSKNEERWQSQLYGPARELLNNKPLLYVRGNHDVEKQLPAHQPAEIMLPYPDKQPWSVRTLGPIRMIMLDTNVNFKPGSAQYKWLRKELQSKEWSNATFKIVVFHHIPETSIWYKNTNFYKNPICKDGRDFLIPLLEKAKTDVVLAGHVHGFEHQISKNKEYKTHYITSGGGGGELDTLKIKHKNSLKPLISSSKHNIVTIAVSKKEIKLTAYDIEKNEILDQFKIEKGK